jgi:hypothetical protein
MIKKKGEYYKKEKSIPENSERSLPYCKLIISLFIVRASLVHYQVSVLE